MRKKELPCEKNHDGKNSLKDKEHEHLKQQNQNTLISCRDTILPFPDENYDEWRQRFDILFIEWKKSRVNHRITTSHLNEYKITRNSHHTDAQGGI